ncbi:SMI1 / KNR4 family [Porphyromonas macacae]|uniref:SMI1 / KNR4 family n=1 Tax=Porphyromonas macacae TaxID=28115 RepID=A0A379E7I6_9PORP|nr:SMI1/KNR4 family protein [Porphyromonas macacae]SUB88390.1 SMI1 / KNR4 family [Porphyromonas macacae]
MKEIIEILTEIENTKDCTVSKLERPIKKLPFELPKDLEYYLKNYSSIVLFQNADYSIKIVGVSEFKRANPVIVGEEAEDDISHNWYIIADDNNSQYITIDLTKDKLGYCYDSFWDRHGVVGEQAVIAQSFTELLERLYNSKGQSWYWIDSNFQSYGDAYDD